jgi:hypothetical protein
MNARTCSVWIVMLARTARADHPPDPFAAEYAIPAARDVGAVAGQVQLYGAAFFEPARQPELGVAGIVEQLTMPHLGVRSAMEVVARPSPGESSMTAFEGGAALHLLPYHRVDLSLYSEGGVAVFAPLGGHHARPIFTPGAACDVWLSSYWFARLDVHVDWSSYHAPTGDADYVHVVTSLGLGIGL